MLQERLLLSEYRNLDLARRVVFSDIKQQRKVFVHSLRRTQHITSCPIKNLESRRRKHHQPTLPPIVAGRKYITEASTRAADTGVGMDGENMASDDRPCSSLSVTTAQTEDTVEDVKRRLTRRTPTRNTYRRVKVTERSSITQGSQQSVERMTNVRATHRTLQCRLATMTLSGRCSFEDKTSPSDTTSANVDSCCSSEICQQERDDVTAESSRAVDDRGHGACMVEPHFDTVDDRIIRRIQRSQAVNDRMVKCQPDDIAAGQCRQGDAPVRSRGANGSNIEQQRLDGGISGEMLSSRSKSKHSKCPFAAMRSLPMKSLNEHHNITNTASFEPSRSVCLVPFSDHRADHRADLLLDGNNNAADTQSRRQTIRLPKIQ